MFFSVERAARNHDGSRARQWNLGRVWKEGLAGSQKGGMHQGRSLDGGSAPKNPLPRIRRAGSSASFRHLLLRPRPCLSQPHPRISREPPWGVPRLASPVPRTLQNSSRYVIHIQFWFMAASDLLQAAACYPCCSSFSHHLLSVHQASFFAFTDIVGFSPRFVSLTGSGSHKKFLRLLLTVDTPRRSIIRQPLT